MQAEKKKEKNPSFLIKSNIFILFESKYILSEAVNAIWVLSFDEEAVKTLNETERSELVDLMRTFKDSPSEKLKEAVNGTLWNLREESRIETLEQGTLYQ